MTTLLALDTTTEACSVALLHKGACISRYEVCPRLHAELLLPMIEQLRAEAQIPLSAIDALAFARGPGAFTGVRIAVGVAQGLAFALQRPVIGVSTLALIAQRAQREYAACQVAVAMDARMGEVYWGCYRLQDQQMQLLDQERVAAPEQVSLPSGSVADWFAAGTGWARFPNALPQVVARDDALLPHALDLLTLAQPLWNLGQAVAAEQALPVYLRDNVATPKRT